MNTITKKKVELELKKISKHVKSLSNTLKSLDTTVPVPKLEELEEPGKLEKIILGPMFSGKTTELNSGLTIRADLGESVAYINHIKDTRSKNIMSTHSSCLKLSPLITYIEVECLSEVDISKYRVIGVDEFQFFNDKSPS